MFTADLIEVVQTVLARAGESGMTAERAVEVLESEGITVPGDTTSARVANMRGLFAWVDPSVGVSKRGAKGGFTASAYAAPKAKKGQGLYSQLKALKQQGISEEAIHRALEQAAYQATI